MPLFRLGQSVGKAIEFVIPAHAGSVSGVAELGVAGKTVTRLVHVDLPDEAIAEASHGLDVERPVDVVRHQHPQLADALLGAMRVPMFPDPDEIAHLAGTDHLTGSTNQKPKHSQCLGPERKRVGASPERAGLDVEAPRGSVLRCLPVRHQIARV